MKVQLLIIATLLITGLSGCGDDNVTGTTDVNGEFLSNIREISINGTWDNKVGKDSIYAMDHLANKTEPIIIDGKEYKKGIFIRPTFSPNKWAYVEYYLNKQYKIFSANIGISDLVQDHYSEWGSVNQDRVFQGIKFGASAPETENVLRIGAGCYARISIDKGSGYEIVWESSYQMTNISKVEKISVDISGARLMRLEVTSDGEEQADMPYRDGLQNTPVKVLGCAWLDYICWGNAFVSE